MERIGHFCLVTGHYINLYAGFLPCSFEKVIYSKSSACNNVGIRMRLRKHPDSQHRCRLKVCSYDHKPIFRDLGLEYAYIVSEWKCDELSCKSSNC